MTDYDYELIPPGYYHRAMVEGPKGRRFWHREKFDFVAAMLPRGPHRLLDIGCGPGSFFFRLQPQRPELELYGTDLSRRQMPFARDLNPGAHFLAADATCLPLPADGFDIVTMIEVIEHLPQDLEPRILAEILRVLKPGGRLFITTPNYRSLWPIQEWLVNRFSSVTYEDQHINRKTIRTLPASLDEAGFEVRAVRTFFVLCSLVATISDRLARWMLKWEQRLLPRWGSIVAVEAAAPPA